MKESKVAEPELVSRRIRVAEAVAHCVERKKYGDTITREEFLAWFMLTYPAYGTKRDFDRVNVAFVDMKAAFDERLLTDHKMALESERYGKWRIVVPSEQASLAAKVARDGFSRTLTKAKSIADNVDVEKLTDAERSRVNETAANLAAIEMFASKSMRKRLSDGRSAK